MLLHRSLFPRHDAFQLLLSGLNPRASTFSAQDIRWTQTDKSYIAQLDVPGIPPDMIEIAVHQKMLRIKTRAPEKFGEYDQEWSYRLPENSAEDKIQARLSRGRLEIEIEKHAPNISGIRLIPVIEVAEHPVRSAIQIETQKENEGNE